MAPSVTVRPKIGATQFAKPTKEAVPSALVLQDSAGYSWYIWVDTTGDLRTTDAATYEAAGFNFLTGGTVVGSQS
jgi:hypothetical protein